jgi:hypothetical protein
MLDGEPLCVVERREKIAARLLGTRTKGHGDRIAILQGLGHVGGPRDGRACHRTFVR